MVSFSYLDEMLKFIKSTIADYYYRKALHLMGVSSPSLALHAIRKAVKIEPNEKIKARYLSLQGELEWGLGYEIEALETLRLAKQIIEQYPEYLESSEHRRLAIRIEEAINTFERKKGSRKKKKNGGQFLT